MKIERFTFKQLQEGRLCASGSFHTTESQVISGPLQRPFIHQQFLHPQASPLPHSGQLSRPKKQHFYYYIIIMITGKDKEWIWQSNTVIVSIQTKLHSPQWSVISNQHQILRGGGESMCGFLKCTAFYIHAKRYMRNFCRIIIHVCEELTNLLHWTVKLALNVAERWAGVHLLF